jgi:hypothetical protein
MVEDTIIFLMYEDPFVEQFNLVLN